MADRPDYIDPIPDDEPLPGGSDPLPGDTDPLLPGDDIPDVNDPLDPDDPDVIRR
ncbi:MULTISPECIES: hypothetical protein [Leclercia]|jgi:hypothetical protein|uniref:hypothetical protein n=1 Tax=Leclercia TaxID=83654 RepID=UPI00140BC608|nr:MULTISPECIES: hypothetical protein [Leclercia]MCT9846534.1 hypothetical protein [Leclercia adecarboxylata ATCC 23216 = NBRC 102595]MCU6684623.1 hypothetical protein [Leclercia tamurae]MDY0921680.1 hypothetical protein [Leclercia sp. CFBP8987]QIK14122.1 hypothetical protein G7090_12350 [Leclercia sp. 29361]